MSEEEIKHFKAMLRQGSLRHMNILLDDKFQKELLNIIKDYERVQQENTQLKSVLKEIREYVKKEEKEGTLWTVKSTDKLLEIIDKAEIKN